MPEMTHRGGLHTLQNYRGIPIHAAKDVHQKVCELLSQCLPPGAKVADIGAGHGALSLRLHDSGFKVASFDLDCSDWLISELSCQQCDVNGSLDPIAAQGPYEAVCMLEVIDHLENPRNFLRNLIKISPKGTLLVISSPNPLDTFSCIALFTRGIFNWASPGKYFGGGHISILPHWLIAEHLKFLGIEKQEWRFLAPYRHPSWLKNLIYRGLSGVRKMCARETDIAFFEGETSLVIARV